MPEVHRIDETTHSWVVRGLVTLRGQPEGLSPIENHKAEGTKVPQGCQGLLPTSPHSRFLAVGRSRIDWAFEQVGLFAFLMDSMSTEPASQDQFTLFNDSNNYCK